MDSRLNETDKSVIDPSKISFKIITDEPSKDAPDFKSYANQLTNLIVNSNPRFTVGIYGGWGTGKTTLMEMIRRDLDLNYASNVEPIWFDSWRYENEEYSAMVPLLRTIILHIENGLNRKRDSSIREKKYEGLTKLKTAFTKAGNAIIRNTTANIGLTGGEILQAGASLDIGKTIDDYRSDGYFISGQDRIYFHKHISEHIKEQLNKIRYNDKGELVYDFRLVIFVDDLDRCTPDKALELLESTKTFFDIEGIIYVIGIDPTAIDSIVETKYGEKSSIEGLDYLQKIVQLPFQIPVWNADNLINTIKEMVNTTGLPKSFTKNLITPNNVDLIVKSAKMNPRDVKRFINSIVLSMYVYGNKVNIDSMICIQAFYFHGQKWLQFLKMITTYYDRIEFLMHFILIIEKRNMSTVEDVNNLLKEITRPEYPKSSEKISDTYRKLIDINDQDLITFLREAAKPLLKIGIIEEYLRVIDDTTKKPETRASYDDVKSYESISRLQNLMNRFYYFKDSKVLLKNKNKLEYEITKFITSTYNSIVHLPYVNLSNNKLKGINLSNALLFKANLSSADLSAANLEGADLSYSYLSGAKLARADLLHAKFIGADLSGVNLSSAFMLSTDFSYANLSYAKLSKGKFAVPAGELHGEFEIPGCIFTGANLSNAEISNVDFSESIFTKLKNFDSLKLNANTNFKEAFIEDSNFLEYISKFTKNIPSDTIKKDDLETVLKKRQLRYQEAVYQVSHLFPAEGGKIL